MRTIKFSAALLALLLFFVVSADAATRITLLHTNDTHSHMLPFDSKQHGPDSGGIVRRAGLIEKIRQEGHEPLLLDAGDILQGTPLYNIFMGEACYRTARACGYDATTLGNHELDNDLANLQTQLSVTGMRLLCCNVFYRDSNRSVFEPYYIFKRNGLKIAVIGSIGNEAWEDIDRKIRAPMHQVDQTTATGDIARRIRPYVDLIVVLSHAGLEFDKQMAASISEIDVILGGHTHVELHQPILVSNLPESGGWQNGLNGTIVAQTGEWGHFLGRLDLTIDTQKKITDWSGQLLKVSAEFEHLAPQNLKSMVAAYEQKLNDIMNKIVGEAAADMVFPKEQRKKELLPMGAFTAMSMQNTSAADVCIVNSGAIRTDLKAGPITRGAIFEALPYDNTVVTFTMSGLALQKMLDFVAANFGDPDGYQISGVTGILNKNTGRAENVLVAGKPIVSDGSYRVSTTSFMANGNIAGDKLFADIQKTEDSGIFMRDAALAWLEKFNSIPDLRNTGLHLEWKN